MFDDFYIFPITLEGELSFDFRPCTQWEPCGKMNTKDCALGVSSHLNCTRHQFHYHHWNWELEGGQIVQDEGFSTTTAPISLGMGPFDVQRLQPPP